MHLDQKSHSDVFLLVEPIVLQVATEVRRSCGSGTTERCLGLLSLTVTNRMFKNVLSNIIKSKSSFIILSLSNKLNAKHMQIEMREDEYH